MILKSMARKTATFGQLAGYMDRKAVPGYAHFWNLDVPYGSSREEVVRRFESNDLLLRGRANGNRLYHEILSLKKADGIPLGRQQDILHDLAAKWLAERAPGQLGYARMHAEKGHVHYHIMLSAGERGRDRPVRLERAEFARMQRDLEAYAIQRFPQLGVERRYGRDPAERPRAPRAREDALRRRTGVPTDRDLAAGALKEAFARARSWDELSDALAACGFTVHRRGDAVSFGKGGRRYRLRTLGLEGDFRSMAERLPREEPMAKDKTKDKGALGKMWDALRASPSGLLKDMGDVGDAALFGADRFKSFRSRGDGRKAKAPPGAEVERLRAEAERLRAEAEKAKRERAEAELAALREAREWEAEKARRERELDELRRSRGGPERDPGPDRSP